MAMSIYRNSRLNANPGTHFQVTHFQTIQVFFFTKMCKRIQIMILLTSVCFRDWKRKKNINGRILLGDNTGGREVVLNPIKFPMCCS
jgi:hypothetical protein